MAQDVCAEVGDRIRELRAKRNWRQIDLAELAQISENYVSDLEAGKKEICIKTLKAVAAAFGMTVSQFMNGI